MPSYIRRFVGVLLFLAGLTVAGVVGYMVVEGWSFYDALYMSAITLTAVGYQEVHPLSQAGRYLTMGLLLGGFTWMGVWFAFITSFVIELDLRNVFRTRKIMKAIESLSKHVIICGAGRTGRQVAEEFTAMGREHVVIEHDPERVEQFHAQHPDALVIQADATLDATLEQAGIARAQGLITSLSADTDNLFVCLSARDLNPDLVIVARAYEEGTMSKMYRAGADHVVSPNVSSAVRMASVMLRPSVLSFLDVATRSAELSLRLEEASVDEASPLSGMQLKEARIPEKTGLIVIAVRKVRDGDGRFVFNPVAETRLEPGDDLIVLGSAEQLARLQTYLKT